jgi:hypothetical protein
MKAIEINGEIKVYNSLPNSWKGVMGNFSKLSDEEIKSYGFYDVIIPEYDIVTQELGNIYFNKNVFTYYVNEKNISETVEELKERKLKDLQICTNLKLAKTDWYITRLYERNVDIPDSVKTERSNILTDHNTKQSELNLLTTKADIIRYEFK